MQAFTIYEESISESRAQLQAITLIIGTLQTARVFGTDNYDTLITKAALHGAKLLKKGQQATAVALASHLWWQTEVVGREGKADKVRFLSRFARTDTDEEGAGSLPGRQARSRVPSEVTPYRHVVDRRAHERATLLRRAGPIPLLLRARRRRRTSPPSAPALH